MEQLLQDVAHVERLGSEFESTYYKVTQCSSDIQGVTAALAALDNIQDKTQQVYVQRPGGVVLGLAHSQARQVLKDDLELCKERQQQLQQKQKALTEMLGDQGDLGQSLLDAVV